MLSLTTPIFLFSLIGYFLTVKFYKNLFNPIGVFTLIWGTIPFLYDLRLSYYFDNLGLKTYLVVFFSLFFFNLGCLSKTKFSYPKRILLQAVNCKNNRKAILYYSFFFALAMVEVFIKTPPLLSNNPFSAYMEGVGVRFLHFTIVLLPITYVYIILFTTLGKRIKFILFFPVFFFLIVWMQRGHLIWFLLMLAFVRITSYSIKKQSILISIFVIAVFLFVNILGNYRTKENFNELGVNSLSELAGTKDLPPILSWGYMYLTASLQNIDQTLYRSDIQYKYGYDVIKPVLSLIQVKNTQKFFFGHEFTRTFIIKAGFNVPTYLHWIYLNFGYIGFIIIPFIIGRISQMFYNKAIDGDAKGILLYALWMPFLVQTFHDFLFWDVSVVLIFLYIFLLRFNFRLGSLSLV